MDEDPGLFTAPQGDARELVDDAPAMRGVLGHLLELGVEGFALLASCGRSAMKGESAAARPVDVGMGLGKEEREELLEVALEGFFPGAVVVVALGHGRERSKRGASPARE